MNVLAASVAIIYTLLSGSTYQACYQKVGGSAVCVAMAASPHNVVVEDDADYDFWVKVNGVDSAKTRYRTPKKSFVGPTLIVEP